MVWYSKIMLVYFIFVVVILVTSLHKFVNASESTPQLLKTATFIELYIDKEKMKIDGQSKSLDCAPVIENDTTLVPIRVIAENLGCVVDWDNNSNKITIKKNKTELHLQVGSYNVAKTVNSISTNYNLEVAPVVRNDRVLVPLRFIVESFDCTVKWYQDQQKITIFSESWSIQRIGADNMKEYLKQNGKDDNQVIVAVIDSGVNMEHEYLGNRLTNPYDMITKTEKITDIFDHGTHVAGIVASCTPEAVKIMPINIYDSNGYASSNNIITAIEYAVENGAKVINLSLEQMNKQDSAIDSAINEAIRKNCVVVVSAGNSRSDCTLFTPSGNKNAIVVTAVNIDGNVYEESNFGKTVTVSAPGVEIVSSSNDGSYSVKNGTSFAAPYVTSAVAMLIMDSPNLSPKQIKDILMQCCDDKGGIGWDQEYGAGIIDLNKYINNLPVLNGKLFSLTVLSGKDYSAPVGDEIEFAIAIKTAYERDDASNDLIFHVSYINTSSSIEWIDLPSKYIDNGTYTMVYTLDTNELKLTDGNYIISFALFHSDNYKAGQAITQSNCFFTLKNEVSPMISAGYISSLALRNDGTVWSWGLNRFGDLGQEGDLADFPEPKQIDGLNDIVFISASIGSHSAAIDNDEKLWTWGANGYGQLGTGDSISTYIPQKNMLTNIKDVSVGIHHTLILKKDGSVWTCGNNLYSQLGYKTTENQLYPKQVSGIKNAIDISAGFAVNFVLCEDGNVWGWGHNRYAQICNIMGTYGSESKFIEEPYKLSQLGNVVEIAPGNSHVIALKNDGTVWTWGRNNKGQLGDNTTIDNVEPTKVSGLENIVKIAAGATSSASIDSQGNVWVWGHNDEGQLGDGTYEDILVPTKIEGLENIVDLDIYFDNMLALDKNGYIWSWGGNNHGQLGDGTGRKKLSPLRLTLSLLEY